MDLPKALLPAVPLDGTEFIRIRQGGAWVYANVSQVAAVTPAALNTIIEDLQAALASLQSASGPLGDSIPGLQASVAALQDSVAALQSGLSSLGKLAASAAALSSLAGRVSGLESNSATAAALNALTGRVATLESKPSPVQHFTAAVSIPTIAALARKAVQVSVKGIFKDDIVLAEPQSGSALPAGMIVAYTTAPAADTVEIGLAALLAVSTAQNVPFNFAALR